MNNQNAIVFRQHDEEKKGTNTHIVSGHMGIEFGGDGVPFAEGEKISITSEDALVRIEQITDMPKLARFVRTLGKHGLINVLKGVPYYERNALTSVDGVDKSQEIISVLLAKRGSLSVAASAVSQTAENPVKKSDKELRDELISRAAESIPSTKDQKELEIRAYALHQAGVLTKINTDRGYTVKPLENIEGSQILADLINDKKRQFHVGNLIKKVEKSDNRQDVLVILRQAIVRCFVNKDRTHKSEVPGSDQLIQAIERKLQSVNKEKPLKHTIESALKKFLSTEAKSGRY
jgi:hypothetical protein